MICLFINWNFNRIRNRNFRNIRNRNFRNIRNRNFRNYCINRIRNRNFSNINWSFRSFLFIFRIAECFKPFAIGIAFGIPLGLGNYRAIGAGKEVAADFVFFEKALHQFSKFFGCVFFHGYFGLRPISLMALPLIHFKIPVAM